MLQPKVRRQKTCMWKKHVEKEHIPCAQRLDVLKNDLSLVNFTGQMLGL